MPKSYLSYLQSPEVAGIASGLLLAAWSPNWSEWLIHPGLALAVFVGLTIAAAFWIGAVTSVGGHPMEIAVRRGAGAGAIALAIAGSLFLWGAGWGKPWYEFPRTLMIFGASILPALFAGSIAAGMANRCLRRKVEPLLKLKQLPRYANWGLRGLVGLGLVTALVSPIIPQPEPEPKPAPVVQAPPIPTPPPQKPRIKFTYQTPPELLKASPLEWKIKTTRSLGTMNAERGVAFSNDQRYLAWGDSENSIVVHDLESEDIQKLSGIPYSVVRMAFSPDAERLFVVMRGSPVRVGVGNLKNNTFVVLPQPKKYTVPSDPVSWQKEDEVIFIPNRGAIRVLDLENLVIDEREVSETQLNELQAGTIFDLQESERWKFARTEFPTFAERPEIEGTPKWEWQTLEAIVLTDKQRAATRVFPDINPGPNTAFFGVRDGSKLMQVRGGELTVHYFETGPVPPLRWKIPMPHGPEKTKNKPLVERCLARGSLSLLMYPPMINPLNGKTVGPEREQPKAILRVLRWEGKEAEVWIESGFRPYTAGDVFSDLYAPGNPPTLVELDQKHPWWTKVPEPTREANDPNLVPLRKDVERIVPEELPPPTAVSSSATDSLLPPAAIEPDDLKKSVSTFIYSHHASASAGRLREVVNNYAERVDHFKNGVVGRDFILKDETEYHQKYIFVREIVKSDLAIQEIRPGRVEVIYLMANQWQRLDNTTGGATFRISLTLEMQASGWKIVRHKSDKQN